MLQAHQYVGHGRIAEEQQQIDERGSKEQPLSYPLPQPLEARLTEGNAPPAFRGRLRDVRRAEQVLPFSLRCRESKSTEPTWSPLPAGPHSELPARSPARSAPTGWRRQWR